MAATKIKGGDKLDARLREIAQKLGKGGTLRVGFLESAKYPDGKSVAMVAAILNFGLTRNGKMWPFFTNMVKDKSDGWGDAVAESLKDNDYDVTKSLHRVGEGIEGQLRQAIQDMNSPALEPSTIARKGFDKPLIDTADMYNSVQHEVKTT